MKINYILLLLIVFSQLTFSQDNINSSDNNTVEYTKNKFTITASLFAGIVMSHNDGNIHIADNKEVILKKRTGYYWGIGANTSYFLSKVSGISIGAKYNSSYIYSSIREDNNNYKYFDEQILIKSITFPLHIIHKWKFAHNRFGIIFNYGLSAELPLSINTTINYEKNNFEKLTEETSINNYNIVYGIDYNIGFIFYSKKNINYFVSLYQVYAFNYITDKNSIIGQLKRDRADIGTGIEF